jgi:hypothetical protein
MKRYITKEAILKKVKEVIENAELMKKSGMRENFLVYIGEIRAFESCLSGVERKKIADKRIELQESKTFF